MTQSTRLNLELAEVKKTVQDFVFGMAPIIADSVTENIASLVRLNGPVGLARLAMPCGRRANEARQQCVTAGSHLISH